MNAVTEFLDSLRLLFPCNLDVFAALQSGRRAGHGQCGGVHPAGTGYSVRSDGAGALAITRN